MNILTTIVKASWGRDTDLTRHCCVQGQMKGAPSRGIFAYHRYQEGVVEIAIRAAWSALAQGDQPRYERGCGERDATSVKWVTYHSAPSFFTSTRMSANVMGLPWLSITSIKHHCNRPKPRDIVGLLSKSTHLGSVGVRFAH